MRSITSNALANLYIALGFIGFVCCSYLHTLGSGSASTPVSVEFSRGNPLAIAFFATTFFVALIASILYWRLHSLAESIVLACICGCVCLLAATGHTSEIHQFALAFAIVSLILVPAIQIFREEVTLAAMAVLAMTISVTFVLIVTALLPSSPVGLGIAERVWFAASYLSNAWILGVAHGGDTNDISAGSARPNK